MDERMARSEAVTNAMRGRGLMTETVLGGGLVVCAAKNRKKRIGMEQR